MIVPHVRGRGISIMIWGAIWIGGRLDLVIMVRDPESKKNGYSARSYHAILGDQLPKQWKFKMKFKQDNAPIRTARIIKQWFKDPEISLLEWPPYSNDMNPIENIWAILKSRLMERWPHLLDGSRSQESLEALQKAIVHVG